MKYFKGLFTLIILLISFLAKSQDVDSLFNIARELAFNGNREEARKVCNQILNTKPTYLDAAVLKGRTYAWDKMYDSSVVSFQYVFSHKIGHRDGISAMTDVLIWSKNYEEALKYANIGISFHPTHQDFYIKKATILLKIDEIEKAKKALSQVLDLNPSNEKALAILKKENQKLMLSKIEVVHDFEFFQEPYIRRRHLTYISYANKTPIGSVIARLYVNDIVKDNEHIYQNELGYQAELTAYPKIANGLYSYVSYGYGFNRLFPKHRAGLELFKSLPWSFETSLGFRYMQFISSTDSSKKDIFVLTGSLGKYYKNFWFSFRPYITPKDVGVSQSYFLTIRYYLSSADRYIFLQSGIGSTPDESSGDVVDYELYKLDKKKIKIGYEGPIKDRWTIKARLGYEYTEYDTQKYRDQWNITLGINYKF
ncbi:MAG: YaiO family outer membrane beta-barrel protein [Bacteroidales bacterium]|nr:YaiO family outer membrane beta-barrel protein [Bacteroidales bacterium]